MHVREAQAGAYLQQWGAVVPLHNYAPSYTVLHLWTNIDEFNARPGNHYTVRHDKK